MKEAVYDELKRTVEWNEGYNTALVIIKGIGFDEAVKVQNKLHKMDKSDTFITGYTQAVIDWSCIPF